MRTPLELWLIVETYFKMYFLSYFRVTMFQSTQCIGICDYLQILNNKGLINLTELFYLKDVIDDYGKKRGRNVGWQLIWKVGHIKPRKMFIQKMIMHELRK